MKTLHLLRHAKSSWDQPGLPDRERTLNKRGLRDAPRMGAALSQLLAPLDLAVSPARRAQLTLEGLCAGWPALEQCRHHTEDDLYTFDSDDLLQWLAGRGEEQQALFLIGHNPALTELVNDLTGEYSLHNLPTAGYARLSLKIDRWRDLGQGCATLEHCLFPKQLRDA